MVTGDPGTTGLFVPKHATSVSKKEPAYAMIHLQVMVGLNVWSVRMGKMVDIWLIVHLNVPKVAIAIMALVQVKVL